MTTKIVGVLNITPDSCSDGGLYLQSGAAINHALEMIKAGADVIDVGAVSTSPLAKKNVSIEEEIKRLEPIMEPLAKLAREHKIVISLDSYNHQTVNCYIDYIDIINDVTGLDCPNMQKLALDSGKEVIFMHSIGVPVDNSKRCLAEDVDVVNFLKDWRDKKIDCLLSMGFKKDKLIFDPGVGFGKNLEQSMTIILRINELIRRDIRMMVGHSRKVFLSLLGASDYRNRDNQTHVITRGLRDAGVEFLRVHDVNGAKEALFRP